MGTDQTTYLRAFFCPDKKAANFAGFTIFERYRGFLLSISESLIQILNMSKIQFHIGLITISLVSACKTAAPPKQTVAETQPLLEIGKEQFSIDDYQDSYNKNKFASDSTKALSPEEYNWA